MIRPFKSIGKYCEDKMNDKKNYYEPDFFSDLKLLTSFSVYFFSKIDQATIKGKLMKEGEVVTFIFPSQIAYGYYGDNNQIERNQPIICKVTLIKHQIN